MEQYDSLMNLIDNIASDFLFFDNREIDVPAAGNLLNKLEQLIKEVEALEADRLKRVAIGLSSLLEKIVLERIEDAEAGFGALEKGITLMQEIGDSLKNTGGYEGNIESFMESIAVLTGEQGAESKERGAESEGQGAESKEQGAEIDEMQDESLLRDFIVEGLEYIDEIEVNLLNLEQDPEDFDCVNAIFRPFHSIKGVAGFLNLETIRDLAHTLENLLDKVRSKELSVSSRLIDIILDGSDVLKKIIVKLKAELEGSPVEPFEIDTSALRKRIESLGQDAPDTVEVKNWVKYWSKTAL